MLTSAAHHRTRQTPRLSVAGCGKPGGMVLAVRELAGLFNPLLLRVQRLVDRRFNLGRYDGR